MLYQLIATVKSTGKSVTIGKPDTLDNIRRFKKAHAGGIGECYNDYNLQACGESEHVKRGADILSGKRHCRL